MNDFLKRFSKHKVAVLSLAFIAVVTLMAAFAPLISPYPYDFQVIADRLQGPTSNHWMGTDALGRDLFSRILFGARLSLAVGFFTAVFSLIIGTIAGLAAGYFGGWTDQIIMRVVDLFYTFPSLLTAILLTMMLGRGITGLFLALGLTAWVTQARLVRGQTLQLKEALFVEGAKAAGATPARTVIRHILPNLIGPMIVSLTLAIPANIMSESFLSFIGLGVEPPFSSWGTLAAEGFRAIKSYPHLIFFPGSVLFLTMIAFNYIGDGLRDYADPKLHR